MTRDDNSPDPTGLDHVCMDAGDLWALTYWAGLRVANGEAPRAVADEVSLRFEFARAEVLASEASP